MKNRLSQLKKPATYAGLGLIVVSLLPLFGVNAEVAARIRSALGGVALIVGDAGDQTAPLPTE